MFFTVTSIICHLSSGTSHVYSSKLEEVNETIDELRKQLAEAEAEATELNTEITSYNQSMQNVKSKYSRQLGRLEKKSKSVKEHRADWASEMESIEKARGAHETVVAAHSEEMVTRENLIDDIKSESKTAKDLEDIVSSAFDETDAEDGAVNGEEGDDTSELDGEVLKYEAVVNEANQNVLVAETNIANLKEELSAIELRVPILEDLKKSAASRRDFKAAGKASKEIKDSLARKELCEAELAGDAMEREQFAKDELEKVTALLEKKKTIADERGKEAGLKQMDRLREKIMELKSILKRFVNSVDGSSEDEDAINVSCVGAFVIESQICVLEAEGSALGEKYGGWEETSSDNESVQSAPSFDSANDDEDDNSPKIVIDKSILERYISLRNEMKELEGDIEDAAGQEDYEKAAKLEEQAQFVRDEFEDAGFSSKKFEQALKNFIPSANKDDDDSPETEKVIDESILEKYSDLCVDIKGLEADIENAVADEDFDMAAEIEEKVQVTRLDIESLGFSIDDMEEALKNRPTDASPPPYSYVDEETDDVAEKVEQEEEDAASGGIDKEEVTNQIDEKKTPDDDDSANKEEEDAVDNTDAVVDEDDH